MRLNLSSTCRSLVMITLCGLFLGACTLVPKPLSDKFFREQALSDRKAVTQEQEQTEGPISLYEAIARALKYNLDFRLELQEKILAQRQLGVSRYDLLPQFVANLNYNGRDNFSGSTSRSLLTGRQSLESSTSSSRDVYNSELKLSWNILDFGLSYIRAQQAADKVLVTEEQKRKVVNRIVQDVRAAYWRAVSNDRLILRLEELMERVDQAIGESKEVEARKLDRPLTALTYQRELISIKRELQGLQRDLSLAKIQLAALMNLAPGEKYELILPDRSNIVREVGLTPQMMEQLALENRSELHELSYTKRINARETKAAILELLPGLNLNYTSNYNDNNFLFNNDWLSYGAQIGWNLLNVIKLPATLKLTEARSRVLDAERLSLSMAIMTQVHVSLAQFKHSKEEYRTAADYYNTQAKILDQVKAASTAASVSDQALIRERMNTLVAEVKYDIAYADLENAHAGMIAAVGIDKLPVDANEMNVEELSRFLQDYFESLASDNLDVSMRIDEVIN